MLYIFYGSDLQKKKLTIGELETALGTQATVFNSENPPANLRELFESDLFDSKKLFVLHELLGTSLTEDNLEEFVETANAIVFAEDSLDKRTRLAGVLLKHKKIVAKEFLPPSYTELPAWLVKMAQEKGLVLELAAAQELVLRLGYEDGSFLSPGKKINTAHLLLELDKLGLFSAGESITQSAVESLVPDAKESIGFAVSNAVAERNATALLETLENYFKSSESGASVAKVLALNAVLSEQFRSIWTFQQAQKQGLSETELLSKTGWKAGKLYPLKRAAAKFSELEVEDILNKLELLDIEQKSTTLPSRVVLELVVSQLIS